MRRRPLVIVGWLLAALVPLGAILLLPAHPRLFRADVLLRLPLELPAIVLVLSLLAHGRGARTGVPVPHAGPFRAARAAIVAVLALVLLGKLADLGSQAAFSRPFSPLVEMHLLKDGWNLASSAVGIGEAAFGVMTAVALLALVCTALHVGLGALRDLGERARAIVIVASSALLVLGVATQLAGRLTGHEVPVQARLVPDLVERVRAMRQSLLDQTEFTRALADDPLRERATPEFAALAGRDVLVVFLESYGRSYVDLERFSARARDEYAALDRDLDAAGLHVKSGWLTSSVRGGRSWLAQASFASGLPITNQARFDLLVTSDRVPVNGLFERAGWRTVGLMPAIQFDWPEGAWYGFWKTYEMRDLGYRGEAFGWVTMPDQYTLAHFENRIRGDATGRAPVMATIALISSHAPWTPIAKLVPWDDVGDGRVFDGSHRIDRPVSWSQRDTVQENYADTVEYTLDTLVEYAARYARDSLIIAFGDHQPSSVVDGWGATADTPVHVISGDAELLERLPTEFFGDGMRPSAAERSLPMWSMRERLSEWFEAPTPPEAPRSRE